MQKSKVIIETPLGYILTLNTETILIQKFIQTATDKEGPWRSNSKDTQFALDSAFDAALRKFLDPTLSQKPRRKFNMAGVDSNILTEVPDSDPSERKAMV